MSNKIAKAEDLMTAFSFTEEDLIANTQLKLSEEQKNKLKALVDLHIFFSFFLTAIFFFVAGIFLTIGFNSGNGFLWPVIGTAGFGLCFYWAICSTKWLRKINTYGGVKLVRGDVDMRILYQGTDIDIAIYEMRINDVKFKLDAKAYEAVNGREFQVF